MDKKRRLLDALAPLEMPFENKQDFVNILMSGSDSSTNDANDVKYIISFYDGTEYHTFIDDYSKAVYSKDGDGNNIVIAYDDIKKDNVYNIPCVSWDGSIMRIVITIPLSMQPDGYFGLIYYDENNEEQNASRVTNDGRDYLRPNTNLDVTYQYELPNMINKELYLCCPDENDNLIKLFTIKTVPLSAE